MECIECGAENPDDHSFCGECGEPLPDRSDPEPQGPVNCPECGTKVPAGFKFCGKCGSRIEAGTGDAGSIEPGVGPAGGEIRETAGEFVVVQPDGTRGPAIPISEDEMELGRTSSVETLSEDPFLSPSHAAVRYRDGDLWIEDISDLNGIFIRINNPVEIADNDWIRLGQQLLRVDLFEGEGRYSGPGASETRADGSWLEGEKTCWGRLNLVNGPDVESLAYELSEENVKIGREFGDILFEEDGFISGEHALLSYRDGEPYLEDLQSSNGTYLRIRGRERLDDGDLILMGQQLFRVEL